MADPIEIVHPDKPHNQRDIDTAMLESAMLKSGATLAMMKSAAAEYEELGKIKSVAEYRAWVSAFKRREQMALATFAAAGSSSGLVHFEVDFSSSAGSSRGLVPSLEHAESSRIPELNRREFKGLMERRIESLIAGPSTYVAAYAQDDIETLCNVTALVQQQQERQKKARKQDAAASESNAKKQKTGKNDHDDDDRDSAVDTVSKTLESRLHLRQRLNRAYDMIEAPFLCQQCAGQGCDYCEWIGVTPSCQTEPVISDRVNHD